MAQGSRPKTRQFTNEVLAQCAERELAHRKRVYPRWVENRKMTQKLANEQIAQMTEIAECLREAARRGQGPTDLFGALA